MAVSSTERGSGGAYLALRVAQYGILFLTSLLVARALGPVGRAHYALPLALATLVLGAAHLTLDGAAGRLLARREATLQELASLLAATTLALSALAVAATLAIGLPARMLLLGGASTTAVVIAASTIPFVLAAQVAGELLLRVGALRPLALASVAGACVQLGLVSALGWRGELTPESALAVVLLGFAVMAVATTIVLGRVAGMSALRPRLRRRLALGVLRVGAAVHPGTVALQLGSRIDLIIVGALVPAHEAGLYSLALTLADSAFLVSYTVSELALHRQTTAAEREAATYTLEFTRQSFLLAGVTAVGACALAYPFVTLLYGSMWSGAVVPFMLLAVATVAITLESPARGLVMRLSRPGLISVVACFGLAVNIAMTVLLTMALGITGAALASVAALWGYALALLWVMRRLTGLPLTGLLRWPSRDDQVVRLVLERLRPRATEDAAPVGPPPPQ